MPNKEVCELHNVSHKACHFETVQEFILNVYLKPRKPDLVLYFTTFLHESVAWLEDGSNVKQNVLSILIFLQSGLPPSSKVIVSSSPMNIFDKTRNLKILALRDLLTDFLTQHWEARRNMASCKDDSSLDSSNAPRKECISAGASFYPNLELYDMSAPIADELISGDGNHYHPIFL